MASIDKEACIGCGLCAEVCSAGIAMGDDGKAKVKNQSAECIKDAAEQCPVGAITA